MSQKMVLALSKAGPVRQLTACALLFLSVTAASHAMPQFARVHQVGCTTCHEVPPMLNEAGLAFQASGYRLPVELQRAHVPETFDTVPLAVWITGRFEDQGSDGASDVFLPKVELISGGPLSEAWSYFAEWRIVSLSLNADGSQSDRGGRFEDLFFEWGRGEHGLRIGQYRSLNQVDVSLRLSASEPRIFGNGLPTGSDHTRPRLASLSRFSPSSRSPSVGWSYRSVAGERAGDGLFHFVTVPFTGELSVPLSQAASDSASFELGEVKGVYGETFYRAGHRSVGAHAFVSDESWLATAVGTYDWKGLFLTAGFGVDDRDRGETRNRASLQAEYLFRRSDRRRAALGARLEEVSDDGRRASWIPYVAMAAPNTSYTLLLQLEYKNEEVTDTFVFDVSLLF